MTINLMVRYTVRDEAGTVVLEGTTPLEDGGYGVAHAAYPDIASLPVGSYTLCVGPENWPVTVIPPP